MVKKDNNERDSTLIRVSLETKKTLDTMGTKKDTYDSLIKNLLEDKK